MSKLVAVVGPTAVGKTAAAVWLAEKLLQTQNWSGIDLVSADSRQVYQDLEITSGADLGAEWRWVDLHWQHQKMPVRLFGVSMLQATQEWSVVHFQALALSTVKAAESGNRLVLIVGGTALYLEHLNNQDQMLRIPPNQELRQKAEELTVSQLQKWLSNLNDQKLQGMNDSDRLNPRRLVRAIEISHRPEQKKHFQSLRSQSSTLTIGLQAPFEEIERRIKVRIQQRIQLGAVQEVEQLRYSLENQRLPIFSTTGVKPIMTYLDQDLDQEQLRELWFRQERQYAKRQLTWWKKRPEVSWFEVTQAEWQHHMYNMIETWLGSPKAIQ